MNWVDIGLNLTNSRFDKDRQQVIANAQDQGISKMVITGTNIEESQKAFALTEEYSGILYSTAGCHPHDAKNFNSDSIGILEDLANSPAVVAIGECGLDFNRDFSPRKTQIDVFKKQLELAVKLNKPVFLHERDAFDTQYQILTDYLPSLNGAVSHCFTGEKNQLEMYLALGLHIGITGWICDERRGLDLFEIVKLIPDERLMVETDGPYLLPRTIKPKPKNNRNEPIYLPLIGESLALARQQSLSHIANITYTNSCRFFNITP